MIRAFGMLTGSLLALGLVLALAGLPGPRQPTGETAMSTPEPLAATPETPDVPPAEAETAPGPDTIEDEARPAAQPSREATVTDGSPAAPPPAEPVSEPVPQRWHAFWSPFRSRVAANGFVAQLARITGLDYRVVSIEPGVYEVAFAYSDESEIEAKLAAIRSATGMAVEGS